MSIPLLLAAIFVGTTIASPATIERRIDLWQTQYQDTYRRCGDGGVDICLEQLDYGLHYLSRGDLVGVGFMEGNGTDDIPEVETDFVLSVVGEELGFAGLFGFLMLAGSLSIYAVAFAIRIRPGTGQIVDDRSVRFVQVCSLGAGAAIAFQVFFVAAGVSALLPLTGLPIPFVSRGGMSMIGTGLLIGFICSAAEPSSRRVNAGVRR